MKQAILQILMQNTHIEGRYIGGGDEPAIIVFNHSDDQDQEKFLEAIAKEIEEVLTRVDYKDDAHAEGYYVPKMEEFRFGFEYEEYIAGSMDKFQKKVFSAKEAEFIEHLYNENIQGGWIRKKKHGSL